MTITPGLRSVFGALIDGDSWEDAIKQCEVRFVRSRSQLALIRPGDNPAGHKMTAWEAWSAYGWELIDEAIENGGAVLRKTKEDPEYTLLNHCRKVGIPWFPVFREAWASDAAISGDDGPKGIPIKKMGDVAFALGLDERMLSYKEDCGADSGFTDKLSALQRLPEGNSGWMSESVTASLAEGVSVIRAQHRLQGWLGKVPGADKFDTSDEFGADDAAARQVGYRLAKDVRESLRLGLAPITSMTDLVEERLGIPIVPGEFPEGVAGAAVSSVDETGKEFRGVLVNSVDLKENVWVLRVTLARELGHALFDSPGSLGHIQVDHHLPDGPDSTAVGDVIKQRADAFALAFLAPMEEVKRLAPLPVNHAQVTRVMRHFGMCETAARRRIESCYAGEAQGLPTALAWAKPTKEDAEAELPSRREHLPCAIKDSRGGKFAEVVMDCYGSLLISEDTAALYLGCSAEEVGRSFDHGE